MTQGHGKVDIAAIVSNFMGTGAAPSVNKGASGAVGVEDDLSGLATAAQRRDEHKRQVGKLFSTIANLPVIGTLGLGGTPKSYPVETLNADMRGKGAESGLPTADEKGVVNLVYRQVRRAAP
jgi:hypothetical protein